MIPESKAFLVKVERVGSGELPEFTGKAKPIEPPVIRRGS
jgi:hypothetical protein